MKPIKRAQPWKERAVFHEAMQNFFTSFVGLSLSLVTESEGKETWSALVHGDQGSGLMQFEGYLGRGDARHQYHLPHLAEARRRKTAVVGNYGGASDVFVPLVVGGKAEAVLVSGPFFKALPQAEQLAQNFQALTGRRGSSRNPLFLDYARVAMETPVLEPPVLKAYLSALGGIAACLAGSVGAAETQALLARLQCGLFSHAYPWRAWNFVAARRDQRQRDFHVQPRLMPWDTQELGLTRHPTAALALALLPEPGQTADEVSEIVSHAALQRACFAFSQGWPNTLAGRLDSTGAFLVTAAAPGASVSRLRLQMRELAQAASDGLRRSLGRPVAVGVSQMELPPERLHDAMHQAGVALHLALRTGKSQVAYDDKSLELDGAGPSRVMERLNKLKEAYSRALHEECALCSDQFVADVLVQSMQSVEAMRLHFFYAYHGLCETITRQALLPPHQLKQFAGVWEQRLQAESSVAGLLAAFREMLQAFLGLHTSPGQGDRQLRLDQARRYLDQRYLEKVGIREVAKAGGFSPSRFSRLFREIEGIGFAEYLLRRRLEHARHLLLHSRLPIQQVAVESGFSSLSYFCQAFKRDTGKNPRSFRSQEAAR